jgi:hypothetical protein
MKIDWSLLITVALAIVVASLVNKFVIEKAVATFESYDTTEEGY